METTAHFSPQDVGRVASRNEKNTIPHFFPVQKKKHRLDRDPQNMVHYTTHTVAGRLPVPVEVGSLSQCLRGSIHPRWCWISSINTYTAVESPVKPILHKYTVTKKQLVLTSSLCSHIPQYILPKTTAKAS